jgi:hypothetical protein
MTATWPKKNEEKKERANGHEDESKKEEKTNEGDIYINGDYYVLYFLYLDRCAALFLATTCLCQDTS